MKFATARGNARIAYDVLGAGAPIVMLHDFGKSSRFWCDIGCVKTCLGQGRQAVMIDLPGHGESSTPNGPVKFGSIDCIEEVIAVLDHAGIARADFLGYGLGGRIALCVAAWARERVHAVAAGGAHPFAQADRIDRDLAKSRVGTRVRRFGDEANPPIPVDRPVPDNLDPVTDAMGRSWPDIADAVARSGVPVLLFVGKEDPRCSVVLSFAEQAGARVIVLPKHDHATTAAATGSTELLSLILQFFHAPTSGSGQEPLPPYLWSGTWV
jgi:pimeloyl-ACP methyl ester carboxylesterase